MLRSGNIQTYQGSNLMPDVPQGVQGSERLLIVSLDVEEDMPRWVPERDVTVRNVQGLIRFQDLCRQYRVKPTYLVDYPVITMMPHGSISPNFTST